MKRTLVYLLIVIALAVWLGTLAKQDPGYVLMSWGGHSLQMGLWLFLGFSVTFITSFYFLLRLIGFVGSTTRNLKGWTEERRKNKAKTLTTRGLLYLEEGNFERAEKFLKSGTNNNDLPVMNFLGLARAAEARGDAITRESYLRQAEEVHDGSKTAVAIVAAEMALARGEPDLCLELLENIKANASTTQLRKEAFLARGDWKAVINLLPDLRKMTTLDVEALEKDVLLKLFAETHSDELKLGLYKKASNPVKANAEVIMALCGHLNSEREAELVIRNALKKQWNSELAVVYGELGAETVERRLKTVKGWLKQHPEDANVHLALGMLYVLKGEREEARKCFEQSLELSPGKMANRHLANLLAFEGELERSNELLRLALED